MNLIEGGGDIAGGGLDLTESSGVSHASPKISSMIPLLASFAENEQARHVDKLSFMRPNGLPTMLSTCPY